MKVAFAQSASATHSAGVSIEEIYLLESDDTYDVIRNKSNNDNVVLIRTFAGEGLIYTRDHQVVQVKKGDTLFFHIDDIHGYACKNDKWDFIWINMKQPFLFDFTLLQKYHILPLPDERSLLREMIAHLKSQNQIQQNLACSMLPTLLYHYLKEIHAPTEQSYNITPALNYIWEHIEQTIQIDDLADIMFLSPRRFRDVFQMATGQTPARYISGLRLDTAKELVRQTRMPIARIADKMGYGNQFYFSKVFKRKYGLPPLAYRLDAVHE